MLSSPLHNGRIHLLVQLYIEQTPAHVLFTFNEKKQINDPTLSVLKKKKKAGHEGSDGGYLLSTTQALSAKVSPEEGPEEVSGNVSVFDRRVLFLGLPKHMVQILKVTLYYVGPQSTCDH